MYDASVACIVPLLRWHAHRRIDRNRTSGLRLDDDTQTHDQQAKQPLRLEVDRIPVDVLEASIDGNGTPALPEAPLPTMLSSVDSASASSSSDEDEQQQMDGTHGEPPTSQVCCCVPPTGSLSSLRQYCNRICRIASSDTLSQRLICLQRQPRPR